MNNAPTPTAPAEAAVASPFPTGREDGQAVAARLKRAAPAVAERQKSAAELQAEADALAAEAEAINRAVEADVVEFQDSARVVRRLEQSVAGLRAELDDQDHLTIPGGDLVNVRSELVAAAHDVAGDPNRFARAAARVSEKASRVAAARQALPAVEASLLAARERLEVVRDRLGFDPGATE